MYFQNKGDMKTVTLRFTEKIAIEDIAVVRKTDKEDDNVSQVEGLNDQIIKPSKYPEYQYYATNSGGKKSKYYKKLMVNEIQLRLDQSDFEKGEIYSFKINIFGEDEPIYSEEFAVNNDGDFLHASEHKKRRWWGDAWFWISIAFILLAIVLVLKIVFF